MDEFRIERTGTMPDVRVRNRYPIKQLKVGESFVIPKDRVPNGRINGLGRRYNFRLSVRKQADGSVRVWRVA